MTFKETTEYEQNKMQEVKEELSIEKKKIDVKNVLGYGFFGQK